MRSVNLVNLRTVLSLVMGLFLSISVWAQSPVNGVVQDSDGEPLAGATVLVKGTQVGTSTNIDGQFTIRAKEGDMLVVTYIGYNPEEVYVTGKPLTVIMSANTAALDEVVVLGYGAEQRKADLSAAVGVVANPSELQKRPVTSTEAMLQGQLPGVTIQSNGGDPTSTPSIVIRGQGSQNGDNVLWVVDGIPGAPINSLSDIESIVVLKDAASAAIYGAQSGAGGVILVTTKGAKKGESTVSYEGQFGIRKASNLVKPLDAEGELRMRQLSYGNAGMTLPDDWNVAKNPWIGTTRTNWMDEIFRTAFYQRHNIVLNGGTENFTSRLSFSYNNDEGTLRNTYSKSLAVRYQGMFKLNKWVTIREDLTWKNWESRSKGTDDDYTGPIMSAVWMPASATVRNPLDGTWGGTTTEDPAYIAQYGSNFAGAHGDVVNPVRLLEAENRYNRSTDLWSTTSLEIANIVPGLKFISRFTMNVYQNNYKNFNPRVDEPGKPSANNGLTVSAYRTDKWMTENTLTYDNSFGAHQVTGLFSTTADRYKGRTLNASGSNLADESTYLQYLAYAGSTSVTDALWGPDTNVALIARVGYSYDDRYFVTASWRRDYAGRLPKENNYGDFPAVTGAWKISNEKFFPQNDIVRLLKVRASWGRVGNLGSIYQGYKAALLGTAFWDEQAQYGVANNTLYNNMIYVNNSVNPKLTWETSEQFDIGLDAELFNNKLALSVDYFNKRTYNLIQSQTLDWPNSIGLNAQLVNLGEVRNRGVEVSATWNHRVNKDWSYTVSGNFAYLTNKVTDIGVSNSDGSKGVWTGDGKFRSIIPYVYQTAEGKPIGSFYLIKNLGIFQSDAEAAAYVDKNGNRIQPNAQAGDLKFEDYNGDGKIDDNDRQYMGNSMPKTTFALSLGFTWKKLSVSAMFQGVGGAQAFYAAKSILLNDNDGNFNRSSEILNAWSETNRSSNIPRLSKTDNNKNFTTASDWYLEDASYVRLKNLTVNYDLTSLVQKWAYLKGRNSQLNVYFSAENLFTITDYSGVDPECGGYDKMKYPVSRAFSLGINLTY
ncbi:MAG: TonB-dependent receptor [Clostridiales bacterium]|nr:TonB-dependent receptor [Clostridiales bacterium]